MISKAILIFALLRVWTCAELVCHREIPSRGEVKVELPREYHDVRPIFKHSIGEKLVSYHRRREECS
jgi:hypothetical protein